MTSSPRVRRPPADELLPLTAVLAELNITRATWYRWRDKGRVPRWYRLPSGHLRIRRTDLDTFVATLAEEPW